MPVFPKTIHPTRIHRRTLLAGTASILAFYSTGASARIIQNSLPWTPNAGSPPTPVSPGGWYFFTPEEAMLIEALVDRIIPPDPKTVGGKDAGCAVFIDRQLAGPYGRSEALYMHAPFVKGTAQQGSQSPLTPAARYKQALPALAAHIRETYGGKTIADLDDTAKDAILSGLESGETKLTDVDGAAFLNLLLKDTKEGFFSDPIYGGNRDMAAWKMIGFPGARYDYRDWVGRHNEAYPLPPVSIAHS